jgi:hypothetical protein
MRFDQKLDDIFQPVCQHALNAVPELRSVLVIYDYHGALNDTPDISHGLWSNNSTENQIKPVDVAMGSYGMVLQTAAEILDVLFAHHANMQTELTETSKKLLAARTALAQGN